MAKTWKELVEDLKEIIEEISELTKEAFKEGDVEKGLRLLSEFRKTVKTAGDLNLIAGGSSIFVSSEDEEDIEKALGIKEFEEEGEPEEGLEEEFEEGEEEEEEPEEEEEELEEPEEEEEEDEEEEPEEPEEPEEEIEEEIEEEVEEPEEGKIVPFNLEDLLKGKIKKIGG
jgi:hypothetical protein